MICLGDDGKVDRRTFAFKTSADGLTIRRVTQAEHYLTFTNETDLNKGYYIDHRDLPMKGILVNTNYRYSIVRFTLKRLSSPCSAYYWFLEMSSFH